MKLHQQLEMVKYMGPRVKRPDIEVEVDNFEEEWGDVIDELSEL